MESWYVHTIMSSYRGGRDIKLGNNNNNNMIHVRGGVRGRVVNVSDCESVVLHRCEFETYNGQDLSCEEANQLACGTSVVLPRCTLEPENCPEVHLGSSSAMESWYFHTIMSS
jgi:hypothetical protein